MLPASHVSDPDRILLTGANGHLGRRLIARLAATVPIVATVRSPGARRAIEAVAPGVEIAELDYLDAAALARAAQGCTVAVHLVGILKESAANRYVDAHERATRALADAARAQGLRRIVYVSILGSSPQASNAALASKGRAEQILLDCGVPSLILRVPMVLGEDDYASRALRRRARSRVAWLLRGASLEQPIYAGDVVEAIVSGIARSGAESVVLDLAGPESVSRAALVRRAGACLGLHPRCVSLPLAPALAIARIAEQLLPNPPVTAAMLGVLDHDDCIDPQPAATELGIGLTGLDEMLRRCVGGATPEGNSR